MQDEHTVRPLGRALLTGATGMVGSSVLATLLEEDLSFALRVKGNAESELFASGVERTFAFRPGDIAPTGSRSNWKPTDYLFKPLQRLPPSIGVTSDEPAQAMLKTAIGDLRHSAILENSEMRELLALRQLSVKLLVAPSVKRSARKSTKARIRSGRKGISGRRM